jgi:hypothetical protein
MNIIVEFLNDHLCRKIDVNLRRITTYTSALEGDVPVLISEKIKHGKRNSVPVHIMMAYEEVELKRHVFLTSALDGSEWPASHPGTLPSVPNEYEVGWAAEPVRTLWRKSSWEEGKKTFVVQSVAYPVIPAPREIRKERNIETYEFNECRKTVYRNPRIERSL